MKVLTIKSFRHWWLGILAVCFLVSCGGGGDGDGNVIFSNDSLPDNTYTATLTGEQEVPANASTATANGVVIVDRNARLLRATVITAGIAGTAAQIREGSSGVAGPVVFPLAETSTGSGIWTTQASITDTQLDTLNAGNYYFDVQSAGFNNGEIRGQVSQQPATSDTADDNATISTFTIALTGSQQVPPSSSSATAVGMALIDSGARTLTAAVTTMGTAGGASSAGALAGPRTDANTEPDSGPGTHHPLST